MVWEWQCGAAHMDDAAAGVEAEELLYQGVWWLIVPGYA